MGRDRLHPSWIQIRAFRRPLKSGEEDLVRFLDEHLPAAWEIYVRPYMNGERPDLALLHPKVGLMFYDVLAWKQGRYKGRNEQSKRRFYDKRNNRQVPNPVYYVDRYRRNLTNLYLPHTGEAIDNNSKRLAPFKTGIYFPNMITTAARRLVDASPKRCTVIGKDALQPARLEEVVPDVVYEASKYFVPSWVRKIRFFLRPPFHALEEGTPIELSKKQQKYATPAPGKHRRVRGVAGSGKTLVLSQRAAKLASEGKQVLVVYYNITLGYYIRHQIHRAREAFSWENIEIVHFHEFCKRYLYENFRKWPTGEGDSVLTKEVPKKVIRLMKEGVNRKKRKYDAILIDEGQDFDETWYEALTHFLGENNEVLMVWDERQNIYERDMSWGGMRFRGPWGELNNTYRLPSPLIREVNRFANAFVKDNKNLVHEGENQLSLGLGAPNLIWREVSNFQEAQGKILEGVRWLTQELNIHPQDIVILVPNHAEGRKLTELFENRGYNVNHIFGSSRKDKSNKRSFVMNDGRLKMSTIHSFKGWELINVILLLPEDGDSVPGSLDMLAYTAITRARHNLIVFNRNERYNKFGSQWPSHWSN